MECPYKSQMQINERESVWVQPLSNNSAIQQTFLKVESTSKVADSVIQRGMMSCHK